MQLVCTSVQCNCYVQLYCSADDNFVHCSCFVHLNSVQCKDRRIERHLPPLTLTLDYLFKLMFISKDRDLMQINNLQVVFFGLSSFFLIKNVAFALTGNRIIPC